MDVHVSHQLQGLTLMQRLNIAVDIADALDYLHNNCDPPIVHYDLKPGNILLNEDLVAHVGDFGLAKILSEPAAEQLINSKSSIGIRGTIGYVAPGSSNFLTLHSATYIFACKMTIFVYDM